MKKSTILLLLAIVFLLIVLFARKSKQTNTSLSFTGNTPTDTQAVADQGGDIVPGKMPTPPEGAAKQAATDYATYNSAVVEGAAQEGRKIVLFFYAPRSPASVALDGNIETNFATIPDDVTIYKVDFDTNGELQTKYDVAGPETVVYLDSNLNALEKAVGLATLDEVLAKVQ